MNTQAATWTNQSSRPVFMIRNRSGNSLPTVGVAVATGRADEYNLSQLYVSIAG